MRNHEEEMKIFEATHLLEQANDWRGWVKKIPFIDFGDDLLVQPIPPFTGAVARFRVRSKKHVKHEISVYLDCYDTLGIVGQPYWEAYQIDGDTARFMMDDTKGLVECIRKELNKYNDPAN